MHGYGIVFVAKNVIAGISARSSVSLPMHNSIAAILFMVCVP